MILFVYTSKSIYPEKLHNQTNRTNENKMSAESGEMKCVEEERATSIESEEPTWEDLDDEDAELPEFEVDEWKTSLPESKITHSWSVELKVEIFKPERFEFRGLSRKIPKGTRKWKTTPLEIRKQLKKVRKQHKKGCLVSGGLESLAHSLGYSMR